MNPGPKSALFRKDVIAWCAYDGANSAFSTSVITALLPIYFTSLFVDPKSVTLNVAGLVKWRTSSDALWAYSNGLFMVLSAIAAPALGAMADFSRSKKKFLAGCAFIGAMFTALLALVGPGQYLLCMTIYIPAAFLWSAGNVFYDGFIPELTDQPGQMDAISSLGYAAGYLGGGLMLAMNLGIVYRHASVGLSGPDSAIRLNFVLVAGWWALMSVPLLLAVREGRHSQDSTGPAGSARYVVREGFARLGRTFRKVRRLPEMAKFLAAFFLYHTGIGTLMIVVAKYAKSELHLKDSTIVGCVLMVQFVAMPAALGFIQLSRWIGSRNSIFTGIAVFTGVVLYAMNIQSAREFWILGFLVALVLGGTQAISRSLYGSMMPPGMSAEFYGFFSIFNKVGTFVGPLAFGLFRDLTGSSRYAILFLIIFFILGFLMLLTVRVARGIEQAKAFVRPEPP